MTPDERAKRIGVNEALYRSINERIEDLNEAFGKLSGGMTVVCECGDAACAEQIEVPVAAYERVRSEPTHFVIRPGHVIADVESTIEAHDGFDVVAKRGEAAHVAEMSDPRS
jgi:hypothetical protein